MAATTRPEVASAAGGERWYAVTPDQVQTRLHVDPAVGLTSQQAADLLAENGPNALPAEEQEAAWRRLLAQYRSYMQLILVGAAIVSLAIQEWSTAVLLIAITVLNAVVGLRQEGKAESAMNALKAMVKATARVRRDGTEAEIAAEEVVVVLLAAGDEVPADECRSPWHTALTSETFDNAKMNWTALAELALAVMITQMDLFNRLLGTTPLRHGQFLLALGSAVLLIGLWEAGKLIARRRLEARATAAAAEA